MTTILYIGDFRETYSTELYIKRAFKELGHKVICYQEDRLLIQNVKSPVDEVEQLNPILVLFSKGCPPGKGGEFIEELKRRGINTACWLFDLYFDLPSNRVLKLKSKTPPFNVETIFSTDGGHDKEFQLAGIKHKLLRQGIYKPEAILFDRPKTHEVIFVGGDAFGNRANLMELLKNKYSKFEWLGKPCEKQYRGLELNELYASTKIVVGDSYPSPNYWSNRIYETLGRGGFLIHPFVEGIETEFKDGEHLVLYKRGDYEDLFKKIDFYLKNTEAREKIRKAGHDFVKNNYTYKHRCIELIKNYETSK